MSAILLQSIPDYGLQADFKNFTPELQKALEEGKLLSFVKRWRAVWEISSEYKPDHVVEIDSQIVAGDLKGA